MLITPSGTRSRRGLYGSPPPAVEPKYGGSTLKTSVMFTALSSSKSAGQRSSDSSLGSPVLAQGSAASVPMASSSAEANPSQSGSLAGTGHGGSDWLGLDQYGQLSLTS